MDHRINRWRNEKKQYKHFYIVYCSCAYVSIRFELIFLLMKSREAEFLIMTMYKRHQSTTRPLPIHPIDSSLVKYFTFLLKSIFRISKVISLISTIVSVQSKTPRDRIRHKNSLIKFI
jgi:hypothetical protein